MPSLIAAGILGAGALGAVGSAVSGSIGASAAKSAASTQAQAANNAAQLQYQMFNSVQGILGPYNQFGQAFEGQYQGATNQYESMLGSYSNYVGSNLPGPFSWNPTQAGLAQTPGYQFTLGQGEQATQNAYAAQGLGGMVSKAGANGPVAGPSGSLGAGLTNYAEGLASTTYNQQLANALSIYNTNLSRFSTGAGALAQGVSQAGTYAGLTGAPISLGENAAAMTGNAGMTTAQNAANYLTSGAAAQAAGTVGAANATTAGITGATNSLGGAATTFALLNALGSGGSGAFGGSLADQATSNIVSQTAFG